MYKSKRYTKRQRLGGLSLSLHPTRKEGVQHRKRRGKPDMTRREYRDG